ncbi:MAG: AmmeMemoRadiSam system protein A [Spirochaetales bacterium]|nr:AmmeMemoRadiSam system protein A [Spirochaetales bacterium]
MSDFSLNPSEKKILLESAREIITAYLEKRKPILLEPTGILTTNCGAFVTLHLKGRLRGCIGHIVARLPLYKTIETMAKSSAFGDPRFSPVTKEELDEIDIEISVLSPLYPAESPEDVVPGTHGIFITNGFHSGVLLPQVPVEQAWNREEYLTHGCYKAGLPGDAWRDPATKIELFTALVFGENDEE